MDGAFGPLPACPPDDGEKGRKEAITKAVAVLFSHHLIAYISFLVCSPRSSFTKVFVVPFPFSPRSLFLCMHTYKHVSCARRLPHAPCVYVYIWLVLLLLLRGLSLIISSLSLSSLHVAEKCVATSLRTKVLIFFF